MKKKFSFDSFYPFFNTEPLCPSLHHLLPIIDSTYILACARCEKLERNVWNIVPIVLLHSLIPRRHRLGTMPCTFANFKGVEKKKKSETTRKRDGRKDREKNGKELETSGWEVAACTNNESFDRRNAEKCNSSEIEASLISYSRWLRCTGVITCLPIATLS